MFTSTQKAVEVTESGLEQRSCPALKEAEGIFTPKELYLRIIDQFRTISLLNV